MVLARVLLTSLTSTHGQFSMSILNLNVKRAPKRRTPTFRNRHQLKVINVMMSPTL